MLVEGGSEFQAVQCLDHIKNTGSDFRLVALQMPEQVQADALAQFVLFLFGFLDIILAEKKLAILKGLPHQGNGDFFRHGDQLNILGSSLAGKGATFDSVTYLAKVFSYHDLAQRVVSGDGDQTEKLR